MGNPFSTEPNWLVLTLFGAILGIVLPPVFHSLLLIYQRLFHKYELEGTWYEYHCTYIDNNPVVYESRWEIKKGIKQQYVVKCYDDKSKISYKGSLGFERGHLAASMKSLQSEFGYTVAFRFQYPFRPSDKAIIGFWVSFDHDTNVSSGAEVLSKVNLSEDQVINILDTKFKCEPRMPLMRIIK